MNDTHEEISMSAELKRDLFSYALRRTNGDHELANDLVQVVNLKAWQLGMNCDENRGWCYVVLRNAATSSWRKGNREILGDDALPIRTYRSAEDDVLRRLELTEVGQALRSLPEHQRTTIFLVDVLGYQYKEAAEATGVGIGTVMSRVYRGRKALRKKLEAT